jgi:hypothetical protein
MPRWLPFALVFVALLGVAAYGLLRPAAVPSRDPADVQQRLHAIPAVIGGWASRGDVPLTERAVNVGQFQAYLNRVYTNADRGASVAVMVLYGEPGDVGAHDPTVCYAGGGWVLDGNPCKTRVGETDTVEPTPQELWSARFRKQNESLQVYWGWGANGDWRADDNPRFAYARHRRIYKVYFQRLLADRPPPPAGGGTTPEPLTEFVPTFLTRLKDAVAIIEH